MVDIYIEHALRVLGRHTKRAAEKALEPLGITAEEYDVMEITARYMANPDTPQLTTSTIAKRMGVLYPSAYNYVSYLQRSGYLRVTTGRGRLLTTKGAEALEDCRHALRHVNRYMTSFFADYGLEDLAKAFLAHQELEGEI